MYYNNIKYHWLSIIKRGTLIKLLWLEMVNNWNPAESWKYRVHTQGNTERKSFDRLFPWFCLGEGPVIENAGKWGWVFVRTEMNFRQTFHFLSTLCSRLFVSYFVVRYIYRNLSFIFFCPSESKCFARYIQNT